MKNSYEKMIQRKDAQIKELTEVIRVLVLEKNTMKSSQIEFAWRLRFGLEDAIWGGDSKVSDYINNVNLNLNDAKSNP